VSARVENGNCMGMGVIFFSKREIRDSELGN
jgi:hypothetical protein